MIDKGTVAEPGMDEAQAEMDRTRGFTTTPEFVTGRGPKISAFEGGGTQVGNPYDSTLAGEDYEAVTYPGKK